MSEGLAVRRGTRERKATVRLVDLWASASTPQEAVERAQAKVEQAGSLEDEEESIDFACELIKPDGRPYEEVQESHTGKYYVLVPELGNAAEGFREVPYRISCEIRVPLPVTEDMRHWIISAKIDGKGVGHIRRGSVSRETGFCKLIFKGFAANKDYTEYYRFLFAKRDTMRAESETRAGEHKSEVGTVTVSFHHATPSKRKKKKNNRTKDPVSRPSDPEFGKANGGKKFWMEGGAATKAGSITTRVRKNRTHLKYKRVGDPVEVITLAYEPASFLAMRKIIPPDHPSLQVSGSGEASGSESRASCEGLKCESKESSARERPAQADIVDLTVDGAALERRSKKRARSMQNFQLSCDLTADDTDAQPCWTAIKITKPPRIEGGVVE